MAGFPETQPITVHLSCCGDLQYPHGTLCISTNIAVVPFGRPGQKAGMMLVLARYINGSRSGAPCTQVPSGRTPGRLTGLLQMTGRNLETVLLAESPTACGFGLHHSNISDARHWPGNPPARPDPYCASDGPPLRATNLCGNVMMMRLASAKLRHVSLT